MVDSQTDVLKCVQQLAPRLRALGVSRLGLFGSFARNEAGPRSDLDFMVELTKTTFDSYMHAKILLEDALELPVDLVLASSLKPRLRERILRELIDVPGF